MKKDKVNNYEAEISCYNGGWAKYYFYAANAEVAKAHITDILTEELKVGFNWNKHPGQFHCIRYKKIGNKTSKYIYTSKPYKKPNDDLTIADYIKINHSFWQALKEVSDLWRGINDPYLNPIQKNALKVVNDTLTTYSIHLL